jgi:hypothetical protein
VQGTSLAVTNQQQDNTINSLINQNIYPGKYIPAINPYLPQQTQFVNPYMFNQIPLIKKYNINITNAAGEYVKLQNLFEDILPQVNGITQKTLITLDQRYIICQYLRSIFIRDADGEDISIGNNNHQELTNLLSHIKFMEINPYHYSKITNNPYNTLPDDFIMFRSCYPVRMNMVQNIVQCAPDNIGINIRIYQMRIYDLLANNIENFTKNRCDLWREIYYYEYIKNEILKKKVCPNFVMVYAWYNTINSGIDFLKLRSLNKKISMLNTEIKMANLESINKIFSESLLNNIIDLEKVKLSNPIESGNITTLFKYPQYINTNYPNKNIIVSIENKNLAINVDALLSKDDITKIAKKEKSFYKTNKCIIMLTEAPTQNILDWGTRAYNIYDGPIKKMIQTGFHDDNVWYSIIFQLLIAIYILDKHDLIINQFSLQNNVFIKDITKDENNIGYWKYNVEGLDFYIPNYGYLVLIDTKYQDLENTLDFKKRDIIKEYAPSSIPNINNDNKFIDNIEHKFYNKDLHYISYSEEQIKNLDIKIADVTLHAERPALMKERDYYQKNIDKYKVKTDSIKKDYYYKIFDNFINVFKNNGGIAPNNKIIKMIAEISSLYNDRNYKNFNNNLIIEPSFYKILIETQSHFLHNRIGTPLKDIEENTQTIKSNINLKTGDYIAYPSNDRYIIGIYINNEISRDEVTNNIFICARDQDYFISPNSKITIKLKSKSDIIKIVGNLEQTYKINQKITEDDLLETYYVT